MRYSINKVFIYLAACLLISSCGKDDFVNGPTTTNVVVDEKIIGTAFFDLNADGVGDNPMKGAHVYYGDSSLVLNPNLINDPNVLFTRVESDGSYIFEGVPPADNKILLLVVDYAHTLPPFEITGTDTDPDGDTDETLIREYIAITLDDNEVDDGNDFLGTYLPLSISGAVLLDSDGDGLGDTPAPNYFVRLSGRLVDGQPSSDEYWIGTTNSSGIFRIAQLDPGEYVLSIEGNSQYELLSGNDLTPDPDGIGDPLFPGLIPVDLEQDEHDAENTFVVLSRLGEISGKVTDELSNKMEHIWIGLFENIGGAPAPTITSNTYTDAEGLYSFVDVPSGNYFVGILDADINIQSLGDDTPDPDGMVNPNFPEKIPVTLESQEVDADNNFIVSLVKGRISGRVLEDVNNDGIGDVPVANDILLLHYRGPEGAPISNPNWPWNEEVAYTDQNGYYYFGSSIPDDGEFVIQHIGSGNHLFTCISSEDDTPEMGEPQNQHSSCSFIQCDLLDASSEDHDNNYVIDIE